MTSTEHASGTDRIAELARRFEWDDAADRRQRARRRAADLAALHRADGAVARLASAGRDRDARWRRSSRRPSFATRTSSRSSPTRTAGRCISAARRFRGRATAGCRPCMRHIGLYAYRAGGLRAISAAPPCALEEVEKLEQLRALWLGTSGSSSRRPPSRRRRHVDTEEDLAKIRRYLERAPRAVA